ncbi:MAG: hypothetical protein LBR11_04085, partial [Deltaproteobacteria bacterium]|nr:hypothetical protein [Deltaproteobacteria bacterium]
MDENTKLETGQSSPIDDQGSPAVAVGSASQPEPTAAPTSAPSPEPSTVRAAPERAPLERPSPVRPPGRRSVPAPSGATAPAR